MNNEEKIKIGVEVAGNAPDVLESLRNSIRGLERDLRRLRGITIPNPIRRRKGGTRQNGTTDAQVGSRVGLDRVALKGLRERMGLTSRLSRQRATEEASAARATRLAGAEAMRSLRQKMSFASRMARQREAEEDATARAEARRLRDQIKHHRFLFGLRMRNERAIAAERQRSVQNVYSGFSGMRSSASQIRQAASAPAKAAAAGGLVAAGAVRTGIGSRMTTDTAETNLRMFGGDGISLMSQSQVKAVREGWLDKEALRNGMNVPAALNAYTEVLKAGIEKSQAADVTKEILKATAGMDLNVPETTKLVGRLAQLTKGGPAEIGSMLNSMGIVAAQTAADSDELVSSLRRGAGALANKNFKVSDLTAFTGVGISAGIQEGMAGTFIEHQQRDLLNAKYARGQEAKDLNKAFGLLGMGSRGSVSAQMAQNPADTLEKLYTRLGEIADKDPVKANLIASLIGKDEWGGKMLMMAQSSGKIRSTRQAANDPNNKDFLSTLKGERLGSWAGMWNTTKATFQLFWEKFGMGFDGILRDVTTYFADLGQRFDWNRVTLHVQAFLDGMKEGFGVRTWRELIDNITGSMGTGDMITKLKDFGRGISQGITSFVDAIKTIGSSIGFDGQQSAQDVGKLAAQITLLSASLIVLAPVVSVLSLLAGGINLLVTALRAARGLLALLGIGTAAGGAVAAGGAAGAVAAGSAGSIAYLITKHLTDNLPDFKKPLGEGLREDQSRGWMGRTWNWMLGRGSDGAQVQRQSFQGNGIRTLVQPASYGGGDLPDTRLGNLIHRTSASGNAYRSVRSAPGHEREEPTLRSMIQTASLQNMSERMGGLVQFASLGGGLGSALGSFSNNAGGNGTGGGGSGGSFGGSGPLLGNQTPGGALGNVGIGRRGIIGGGGGANPSGMPDPGSGAGAGPYRGLLDHIARSEGTANQPGGGYNTSLGYGRYLPGGREQNLTGMTLNQVLALGDHMRRQPGNPNSSALGRYQIVGNTLRGLMRRLNLSGNEKFDEAMQDRLGAELARGRGSNPQGLANEWASLRGARLQEAVRLSQAIPRGASTTPGARGTGDVASQVNAQSGAIGAAVNASGAAGAVDVARQFNGMHENRNYGQLRSFMGTEIRGAQNAWCADFVNSSLRAVGMRGTNSRTANSFLGWGQQVNAQDAMKGDVLVEHRGRGLNGRGGHAGLATGNKRTNPQTGELELEMISGNYGNAVKTSWERSSKLAVRRAAETGEMARQAVTPNVPAGAQQGNRADGVSQTLPSARMNPDEVARNAPLEPARTNPTLGQRADLGGGGGNGGGGGSPQIIIQGHNGDPEALANAVQRRLSERMGRRTHEVEHHWG